MAKTVLNVGQCSLDHGMMTELLSGFGVINVRINNAAELNKKLATGKPDLILVNRIIDSDGSSGINIIRDLKSKSLSKEIPVMLISNYPEAQKEAVVLGALEGFGKSELRAQSTLQKIKKIFQD